MTQVPIHLLIPAGGRGLRMGGGCPKQFRDWGGVPLLRATVEAFLGPGMPVLAGIALAVPPEYLEAVRAWDFPVPAWVVAGGDSRQDSVEAALAALPAFPEAVVLIHDAVRPFPPAGPVCEAIAAGRVQPGQNLVLVGFGAGLTWAATAVRWGAPVQRGTSPWWKEAQREAGYQLASARSTWRRTARRIYAGTLGPADAPTTRGRLRASIDAGRAAWRSNKPRRKT